jgi:hypothetical protein
MLRSRNANPDSFACRGIRSQRVPSWKIFIARLGSRPGQREVQACCDERAQVARPADVAYLGHGRP